MKKLLSSPSHYPIEMPSLQEYPVKSMQHQEDTALLAQHINQIILHNSDAETVLSQTARVLGEAFRVDGCLIMVTAPDLATAPIAHWYSDNNRGMPPQRAMLLLEQMQSLLPTADDLLVINNIQTLENTFVQDWLTLPLPIHAVLAITTRFQGNINGVIMLIRSQPYYWSDLEQQKLTAIAAPVALAISQIVQTMLIASLQKQVSTSAQYQNLINQLTMASRSSLELNQFLQMATAGTAQTLQVERGLLLLLKYSDPLFKSRERREKIPKAKATVVCEWSNADPLLNQSFWLSECSLCQQAFTNSPKPVAIANPNDLLAVSQETEIAPIFNLSLLPALLLLPLENQGTVLGFLVLQHSSPRPWRAEEFALLEMVSAQVSNTIIQNQTLRQVQSLVEERTAQLKRSLEVQAKLYETTRRQVNQLRQLNQLKDEFISTISHELRTPLTSMNLAIRMLSQLGLPTERHTKYLHILEQQCTQEINLINDLLKLQQLESNQASLNLQTIDLKSKISDLAKSFEEKWADKGLNINVDLPKTSLLFQTDAESLERILDELLTNAGKYSAPDTTVVLKAVHQINQIVLTLTNFGPGISPEDAKQIFDKFRRGQGVTQQAIQGTGLGLALVKCLVQHLNGNIEVFSNMVDPSASVLSSSDCETTFTLTLPQNFSPC